MGSSRKWLVDKLLLRMESPWVTIVLERVMDQSQQSLDYWRIEKADSLIIVPVHLGRILLPPAQYRHGLGRSTEDLPGGRLESCISSQEAAVSILEKEMGCRRADVEALEPLSGSGWAVNSSFSNQLLHVYRALLAPQTPRPPLAQERDYAHDEQGVGELFRHLTCLQCRAAVLESLRHPLES